MGEFAPRADRPHLAIGENVEAEFEVALGEDGIDGARPELLGEGQDGGVNVAVARHLPAQPL